MHDYYFAYGSNMNPARMRSRKLDFDRAEAGSLRGYVMRFNKRSLKVVGAASANVVESGSPDDSVQGVIYRLADRSQIRRMDPFERHPIDYSRVRAPIEVGQGALEAWVYVANPHVIVEGLRPARWYLEHLLEGSEFLTQEYIAQLRGVSCLDDTDLEP